MTHELICIQIVFQVSASFGNEVEEVQQASAQEFVRRQIDQEDHQKRLGDILQVNNLTLIDVPRDGNCFFSAVFMQLPPGNFASAQDLRLKVLDHICTEQERYSAFNTCLNYHQWASESHWNSDLGDLMPYATANLLGCTVQIFSSHSQRSVYTINSTTPHLQSSVVIRLAHNAALGFEHYSACFPINEVIISTMPDVEDTAMDCNVTVTTDSTVDSAEQTKWNRVESKALRNTGRKYINSKGKYVCAKSPQNHNCLNCRFSCHKDFTDKLRVDICETFWSLGSSEERSCFLLQYVSEKPTKPSLFGMKSRSNVREYSLPLQDTKVRVCKSMFLATLCISLRTVEVAQLKARKGQAMKDQRGTTSPVNKTSEDTSFIKSHIWHFRAWNLITADKIQTKSRYQLN